ncbi:MAG TPA: response regulator transcription factor, partial [Sphingobacteriaceae bacterium]
MIKLLIAEDHTIVRKGIRSLLEQVEGIEVVGEASCGQDVLDLINQGLSPDVVLTDLNMPGMNGLDLVEELKNYPSIKV